MTKMRKKTTYESHFILLLIPLIIVIKKKTKQERFQPKVVKYYKFERWRHNPYLVETYN